MALQVAMEHEEQLHDKENRHATNGLVSLETESQHAELHVRQMRLASLRAKQAQSEHEQARARSSA